VIDKIISFVFDVKISLKSLVGKKPPDEIIVSAKFRESNILILNKLKKIKIPKVNDIYNIRILMNCLIISDILNDKKFVKDFFNDKSKISIKKINENKK
jgi:hypothetical protein